MRNEIRLCQWKHLSNVYLHLVLGLTFPGPGEELESPRVQGPVADPHLPPAVHLNVPTRSRLNFAARLYVITSFMYINGSSSHKEVCHHAL